MRPEESSARHPPRRTKLIQFHLRLRPAHLRVYDVGGKPLIEHCADERTVGRFDRDQYILGTLDPRTDCNHEVLQPFRHVPYRLGGPAILLVRRHYCSSPKRRSCNLAAASCCIPGSTWL